MLTKEKIMYKKDFKLFISLVGWMLIPSIYLMLRMNIFTVSNADINILGQMEWFDLIDEIIVTTLTVPLYYLLKPLQSDKYKNGSALIFTFGIYLLFTIIISLNVGSITSFMEAEYATQFLFLQSFAMLIKFITTFAIVICTLNEKSKTINILILSKIFCLIIFDLLLIPNLLDIGASYSEIISSTLISVLAIVILFKYELLSFKKFDFSWLLDWFKIGVFSGLQIFIDNIFYAIMICKMVNTVSESGNYWVANNFIWGWLLLPILCLSEVVKKNNLEKLTLKNSWNYCFFIAGIWLISIPFWKPFLTYGMAVNANEIMSILYLLVPFYLAYLPSSIIDSWFVSKGKVIYNSINSLIVNIGYYGLLYILFKRNFFEPNMNFIIFMFGIGMIVHLVVSLFLYWFETRKNTKQII